MNLSENSILKPSGSSSGVEVDGETVLLDANTGALHRLNDVGAAIWSQLDGSKPLSSIVAELSEESGAEPDRVAHDVQEFLGQLVQLGLVEPADERDAAPDVTALHEPRDGLPASIDTVWVDWYTAQVIDALRASGIEAILLKGPAIRGWLYRDAPEGRSYLDADLLVAPDMFSATVRVLSELGFRPDEPEASNLWATDWRRASDGAVVDLHYTLHGCEYSTVEPWPVVKATAVEEEVGGTTVLFPSVPIRALEIVLVSPADRPWRRWDDLSRALEQLPEDGWREAAAVARELGVAREFGYRLSQSPAGATRATQIGLDTSPPWWLRMEDDPILRWFGVLAALPRGRGRIRVARKLVLPSSRHVRLRDRRTTDRSLPAAYAAWALHVLQLLPGSVLTLLRSLRRAITRR